MIAAEPTLIESLLATLHKLPGLQVELQGQEVPSASPGYRPDADIIVQIAEQRLTLRVEAKREIYPRDVREALWQLRSREVRGASSHPLIPMIAADCISPGAKELLKTERVGYYDRGGSLFVPAPGAYILVDKPAPKTMAKSIRSLFTGRRAQVLHALLLRPREWLTGKDLADLAQVSPATVSQVFAELERLDFLKPNPQGPHKGRQLREPGSLLDQWVEHLRVLKSPAFRRYFVPTLRADQLHSVTNAFAVHGVEYAISFEAAAQRYAPFLSSVSQIKGRAQTGLSLEAALSMLDARAVEEGANLMVMEAQSTGDLLFRRQIGSDWLASPIQVYLDLLRSAGRAKEAAQHLRKEWIRF